MTESPDKTTFPKTFLHITLTICAMALILTAVLYIGFRANNLASFSEPVITLSDGWTLTYGADSAVSGGEIKLPATLDYGDDGVFTLTRVLPEDIALITSPALRIYSNYTDVYVELDGEPLYNFPDSEPPFSGSTGNTYHFIRLSADYANKRISITFRGQLGDKITYMLRPPLLGSKATMLRNDVMQSLLPMMLSGCLIIIAAGIAILYFMLRRQLKLNSSTLYTSIFALLFAVYVFCETTFAQILSTNGYALCTATLMLLAILPIPLMGLFAEEISSKFKKVPGALIILCAVNFTVQTILNFSGVLSYRVMITATHFVMIVTITMMGICLIFSDRREKPHVSRRLIAAAPMILGGIVDITLLSLERPSFNNSLWFTLGVTGFIIIQFFVFIKSFFVMYRSSLETDYLRNMAYRDDLTGIANRNAYENKLKELGKREPSRKLGCIVLDINDLKLINDRYGHKTGDDAIVKTGGALCRLLPKNAYCYRTGGDEFVILFENFDERQTRGFADRLLGEIADISNSTGIPISIAAGTGCYDVSDGNVVDFIRRVDTLMYTHKREIKSSPDYVFNQPII